MDGENNGKPYLLMDDLGVFPYFWKHPHRYSKHMPCLSALFLATWCFPHAFEIILWSGVLPYGRFFERVGREIGY